jgi:hypothetical protein
VGTFGIIRSGNKQRSGCYERREDVKIIRERETIETTEHSLCFGKDGDMHFGFPCDEQGNVLLEQLQPAAVLNLEKARAGYECMGVRTYVHRYHQPAVGRCCCGREVDLDGFTCPCECGRDYNSSGQLLAPRSQWGEETGETLSDILRIR